MALSLRSYRCVAERAREQTGNYHEVSQAIGQALVRASLRVSPSSCVFERERAPHQYGCSRL